MAVFWGFEKLIDALTCLAFLTRGKSPHYLRLRGFYFGDSNQILNDTSELYYTEQISNLVQPCVIFDAGLCPLPYLTMKLVVPTLPLFNQSKVHLQPDGEKLVLTKKRSALRYLQSMTMMMLRHIKFAKVRESPSN